MTQQVHIIGGGLAGSEAAWQLAEAGINVRLSEMRGGGEKTAAHQTDNLAELVCSNSFRSDDADRNAVGLIHQELRTLGSLIMRSADAHRVPAGSALAVDRDGYTEAVTSAIAAHPNITLVRERIDTLPDGPAIIATGPLTGTALAEAIAKETGEDALAFFDALAPIVHHESIDMKTAWMASRWDKGDTKDYINCPMDEAQYNTFVDALLAGEKHVYHEWENVPYFDGCLPIEVMAERGRETLRWGPLKPVGLTNPRNPTVKSYAIVQLRQDNALGTLWNMVGFQTKLKYRKQAEIFRLIPGLGEAQFARLGGLHHNTYLNSPRVLTKALTLKADPRLRFAGQITGVEGYVESAAMGLMAGRMAAADLRGEPLAPPPPSTAMGALIEHITGGHLAADGEPGPRSFQPMNVNFGLLPPISVAKPDGHVGRWKSTEKTLAKKKAMSQRALSDILGWA